MHLIKAIIRKSQMSLFDWKPEKHEEQRTVHATTRHMQSGAVVQVQEHQRRTEVVSRPIAIDAATDLEFKEDPRLSINSSSQGWTRSGDIFKHKSGVQLSKNRDDAWYTAYFPNGGTDGYVGRNLKDAQRNAIKSASEQVEKHQDFLVERDQPEYNQRRTDVADKPTGAQTIVARIQHAKERFDEALMTMAGITKEQAQRVTQYYLDKKLATMDAAIGQVKVKHGGYLDKDVILNAVKETEPKQAAPTRDDLERMGVKHCGKIEITEAFTRYKFDDNRSAVSAQQKIGGIRMDNILVISKDPDAKAEMPPEHTQDNRIYSTAEATQKNVTELLNEFLAPINIKFGYGKSAELQGSQGQAYLGDGSRRLLTRKDATIDTLAHEIAHFVQYDQKGYTHCGSLLRTRGQGEGEHMRLTKEYTAKLKQNKLGYLFMKANGITWRTMKQDLEEAIQPASSFEVPIMEVPKRKPKATKPEPPPAPEYRIAKDDEPESGTKGRFLIHDKDMRYLEIPNEHGEIEANWPTLLEANRALNRHKQADHTLKKTGVKGEYDAVAKSFVHPVSLIKSRKLDGKINFNGLDISIETGRSRCREWKNPHDGSQGMSRMRIPYGYIKSTLGVDGDHYDVFVGPDHSAPDVYIITTMKAPDFAEVDEQKAFLGVNSPEEAKAHFMASYSDPRFFGSMTEMPFDEFKAKVLGTKDDPKLISGRLITEDEIREYYRDGVKKAFAAIGEDWSAYDTAEVFKGMKAELEHTDLTGGDLAKTAMIVVAHLKENPKYYTLMGQAGL